MTNLVVVGSLNQPDSPLKTSTDQLARGGAGRGEVRT